ncbi:MAG: nitroreductase family protein [Rhodobacteraceae bacterium]|nr:nitroreductase family protein [Paracoccaceae bacterium]
MSIADLLRQRYGQDVALPHVPALPEHLLSHRSVRKYLDHALPEGTIEAMVAAAQSASTSSGFQAWSVVAVEDAARRAELARLAGGQQHVRVAPLQMVWIADLSRMHGAARRRDLDVEGVDYLELFVVACVDAALAAQNAALAAEALGLGIVYIGGMRNHPEEVAALLDLPERSFAVFGMCVGHPDPEHPAAIKPRLAQDAVLHRERYALEPQWAHVDAYDAQSAAFYGGQKMANAEPWSVKCAERVATAQSLRGRDRLRSALAALGFPLK